MIIEKQSVRLMQNMSEERMLQNMAVITGTPYLKNEYDVDKAKMVIASCAKKGHHSVLEHLNITANCFTNVATYKDITRHRHCAFTIESTSFVNYGKNELVIVPARKDIPTAIIDSIEDLLDKLPPKIARDWLPQSTGARMIMTTNVREWRWIIALRGDPNDNPLTNQLRDLIWIALAEQYPFFFPPPHQNDKDHRMCIYNAWGDRSVPCKLTEEFGNDD